MDLEKTMFREYDIRGQVNEKELNEKSVYFIARAFGTFLARKKIKSCVLGHDFRSYSKKFYNSFQKGLVDSGINVKAIGLAMTQMLYFAQFHFKIKGCAMITASHNPNGWSGFKLGYDFCKTLLPKDVQKIYKIIKSEKFVKPKRKGKISKASIIDAYTKAMLQKVKIPKKLKVVINARNGTAGAFVPRILKKRAHVIEQYCNLDSSFPHGNPNPSLNDMMLELASLVKKEDADLGFAFDGDGDRLGVVDEKGKIIYPDRIIALLAKHMLQKKPKAKIVFDVKCSRSLIETIEDSKGRPIMWITGHSYIKEKARRENALLAGERSGHIFFPQDFYGFDDGCFASLKLLEFLSSTNKKLSEHLSELPQYFTSEVMHAPCADNLKYTVIDKIGKVFKKKFPNVIDINGVRLEFEDGFGLVRASSNLPVLVLVFEGKTQQRLKEIENIFREELSRFPEISQNWVNG